MNSPHVVQPHHGRFKRMSNRMKNRRNYIEDKTAAKSYQASKEANKEVVKGHVNGRRGLFTRLRAMGRMTTDAVHESQHEASAKANKAHF